MTSALTFSIVIPTFNRPRRLRGCLRSLARLSYPNDQFEVIIVDDGSPEVLDAVVAPFQKRMQIKLFRQENAGPGRARNTGAHEAHGRWLAFTDDDCRPDPAWLSQLGNIFERNPDCLVGGKTINLLPRNAYSSTSQLIVDMAYDFFNADPTAARFFASNNMAVPRERFLELGGFHTGFFQHASEDRELCDRWRHLGNPLRYASEAVIRHGHVLTLRSFTKQHFMYGRGAYRYHELRQQRGSGKMQEDMGFHRKLFSLTRKHLRASNTNRRVAVLALLPVWQVVNAAGYFYERFRGDSQSGSQEKGSTEMLETQ